MKQGDIDAHAQSDDRGLEELHGCVIDTCCTQPRAHDGNKLVRPTGEEGKAE